MLRSKLAKCCIDYFSKLVKALSCNTNRAEPGSMLTVEEQSVKALRMMTSYIEQRRPYIGDMPLVAYHPQMRAVLLHEFKLQSRPADRRDSPPHPGPSFWSIWVDIHPRRCTCFVL